MASGEDNEPAASALGTAAFPRLATNLAVEYRLAGRAGEAASPPWQPARVRDLSEEGLCLLVASLAPGGRNLVRCLEDAPAIPWRW